jgi:spore germination protein YaaH
MEILKGREVMVWTFMGNARMWEALQKYGDRISQIGLFSFKVKATGEIYETGVAISDMMTYVDKWPHIRWLLTVANDGYNSIFRAIRENTNGAQDKFLSELVRIMEKYPWCDGVDIDLEGGGDYSTAPKSTAMFQNIYQTVKHYNSGKMVNICLPGMTSVNGSVGGENWCVYADLAPYCDTASIMSYGMAWAGSAPGPVSPRDWLEGIYEYAFAVMPPGKIYLGIPAYGWNWQIYDTPENLGDYYRGVSHTYYGAKNWMTGFYQFKDTDPPSPQIPIAAYWDDYNKVPWALPHVYDYMEGQDAESYNYPLTSEVYKRRRYLTSYGKTQKKEFEGIVVERNAMPDSYSGVVSVSEKMLTLGDGGSASYRFTIDQTGVYDIAVNIGFPFWDKNSLYLSLDGSSHLFEETRLWWPYWRTTFWKKAWSGVTLAQGSHTLTVSVSVPGVQVYGFKVCRSFTESTVCGEASYILSPRKFKDINGVMVGPREGFKLTFEMLRRKADSALIWYEDFRDDPPLPDSYWTTLDGEWSVWQDEEVSYRPYSQLEGYGRLALKYGSFTDLHLRAQMIFPEGFTGRAGIFLGNLFCCFNYEAQAVELYEGTALKGSFATSFEQTPETEIRASPYVYTIEMRKRRSNVRVYSGSSKSLCFQSAVSDPGGFAGIRSDSHVHCQLLRVGDAYTYEPYECFDVGMPDGSFTSFGRINRASVTWDEEFQVFTLNSDIEEHETRTEEISLDYEFFHSSLLNLTCGSDYPVKIIPRDINIWISRLFLGDSDGFSILYYQDVDSLIYWMNEAAYRWKLRGVCMWSLGQEDLRLWDWMPRQD